MSLKLEPAIRNKDITLIKNILPCISYLPYADDIMSLQQLMIRVHKQSDTLLNK